ncbi:MAG: glycosyltransferase [Reyranellaceae bacterium]
MTGSSNRLRVVQCAGFYFPESVGGTEVYVRDLALALRAHSVDSIVMAATNGGYQEYPWEETPVVRYPSNWAEHEGEHDLSRFSELLRKLDPDVFHLHSWTPGAGLAHLSQAASLGIPCLVTLHLVTSICMRGSMLLDGTAPCDGHVDETRCSYCWVLHRGAPRLAAFAVSRLPRIDAANWNVGGVARRIRTLLSIRTLVATKARELQVLAQLAGRIVAPSDWVRAALLSNSVPPERVVVSRQAASRRFFSQRPADSLRPASAPLRVGFVGRLEPFKGVGTLINAMALLPDDIRLLIAGTGIDPDFLRTIHEAAERDRRIHLLGPVGHDALPSFLWSVDVVAVPSMIMETGPLVVHEAHAAGVPVLGANLGGISERIRHGVDGLLLPFDDPSAWAHAIHDLAQDRARLTQLAANCGQNRTIDDVALEMATEYRLALESQDESTRPDR